MRLHGAMLLYGSQRVWLCFTFYVNSFALICEFLQLATAIQGQPMRALWCKYWYWHSYASSMRTLVSPVRIVPPVFYIDISFMCVSIFLQWASFVEIK